MPALDPKFAEQNMVRWGYKPLEPYTKASNKWKCKCLSCKKTVYVVYADINRFRGRNGCKNCGYRIDEKKAISIMASQDFQPLTRYKNSKTPWKSKCMKCGKISNPSFKTVSKGSKCVYCKGIKVDEEDAIKLFLSRNLKPLEKYKNSQSPWKCECLICGKIVKPRYTGIYVGQGGCIYCRKTGFKYADPSYFYIIYHYRMNAIKVGITNKKAVPDRIKAFKRNGWVLHRKYDFVNGYEAVRLETAILKWLRKDLNLPKFLSPSEMRKTGGASETVSMDSITCAEIRSTAEELIKGYRNNP